jgi:hypothetical protein
MEDNRWPKRNVVAGRKKKGKTRNEVGNGSGKIDEADW